jgi:NADPH:quinone reductase
VRVRFRGGDPPGTVATAAADGCGPPVGARVVTFGWSGAWAQRRAVDTGELALLPSGVEPADAAALPVAGVTALRAVRRLGSVLGRRVLITGASGGVGRIAVQLAAAAGAEVVAASRQGDGLVELGALEVVASPAELTAPVDAAIDNVGGTTLADAHALLRPGGLVLSVGQASLEPTTIDFEAARMRAGGTRIEAFVVGDRLGADLAHLVGLLAAGKLDRRSAGAGRGSAPARQWPRC